MKKIKQININDTLRKLRQRKNEKSLNDDHIASKKTEEISIRVSKELNECLALASQLAGINKSEYIRKSLQKTLTTQ
ncbi:MAG: hypothetical protein MRY83_01925 [Flavobacteriales bacterium]|nr:hypothetical protein [Flavobacteriales bacterium]